jgi:hypothetical protein
MTHAHENPDDQTDDVGGFGGYGTLSLQNMAENCPNTGQYDTADSEIHVGRRRKNQNHFIKKNSSKKLVAFFLFGSMGIFGSLG